jgi:serine/threonine protein kinase
VAIKVIQTRDLPADQIAPQKERFAREARAAGKMLHPGIVTVYDVAEDPQGNPCLVMEYVEGTTLADLLDAERGSATHQTTSFEQRLRIAVQVAEALDYAHRKGVIHRDIKPANIMITHEAAAGPAGGALQAKIADFGIAKLMEVQGTIAGGVLGTPAFVSPEQLTGGAIDARSDIFSFGVVLYWMFTGEKPFKGDSFTAITFQVMHNAPRPAREINFALPEKLDAILARCLAKNPRDRYGSAAELAKDLAGLRTP